MWRDVRWWVGLGIGLHMIACAPELRLGERDAGVGGQNGTDNPGSGDIACSAPKVSCVEECVDPATDPEHCGACGHSCLGGPCQKGKCRPFALVEVDKQNRPYRIAADGVNVYWTNMGTGTVMQISVSGGEVLTLASMQHFASAIEVDATYVYWTDEYTDGSVNKLPIGGGAIVTLAAMQDQPYDLALNSDHVYWNTSTGKMMMVAKTGGPTTTLATGQGPIAEVAADATTLYWSSNGQNAVRKVPLAGATPTNLATGVKGPLGIAVRDGEVYWGNVFGNSVMKVPSAGGEVITLAAEQLQPYRVTVDDTHVYWIDALANRIVRVHRDGGEPEILAEGQESTSGLAVDASAIYWTLDKGAIMKLAK